METNWKRCYVLSDLFYSLTTARVTLTVSLGCPFQVLTFWDLKSNEKFAFRPSGLCGALAGETRLYPEKGFFKMHSSLSCSHQLPGAL